MKPINITAICPRQGIYASALDRLETHPDFHVLDRPRGLSEPGAWVALSRTDVLVTDSRLIDQGGFHALREVIVRYPRLRVLSIFEKYNENIMMETILTGAHGVMVEMDTERYLQRAIAAIHNGEIWMSRDFLPPLRDQFLRPTLNP